MNTPRLSRSSSALLFLAPLLLLGGCTSPAWVAGADAARRPDGALRLELRYDDGSRGALDLLPAGPGEWSLEWLADTAPLTGEPVALAEVWQDQAASPDGWVLRRGRQLERRAGGRVAWSADVSRPRREAAERSQGAGVLALIMFLWMVGL